MRISDLARTLGVNVQTIRYYERRGLLPEPPRTSGGYRNYDEATLERMRFIRSSKTLGFTLEEIRGLLSLRDAEPGCEAVAPLARTAVARLDAQIAELQEARASLVALASSCKAGQCSIWT